MADEDPELATKAPESDAAEDTKKQPSIISSEDTKVDQGASLGVSSPSTAPPIDQPVTRSLPQTQARKKQADRLATASGEQPTGEISKYNNVEVYVTKPADYPHSPSKLLLLLTGGTGVHSTNNQLQADRYAQEGFLVVMPDQFGGDPAPSTTTTSTAGDENTSVIEQIKMGVASVAKSFTIDMWLARQTPEKVLPILQKVIASVKEEYADAVANGGGIYAVGYCFGARYVLLLGSELDKDVALGQRSNEAAAEEGMVKQGPEIKCGAIAHGTLIGREDMAKVAVPMSIVAVEQDTLFPDEVREAGIKGLEERKVEHEVKVFAGVPHGFAVVGDYQETKIKEAQVQAFDMMLAWLKNH